MVSDLAVGALTAYVRIRFEARVPALELNTGLVLAAIVMPGTLSVTPGETVSKEIRRALAGGSVIPGLA